MEVGRNGDGPDRDALDAIWRQRRMRAAVWTNAICSILLVGAIVLMVNYLSSRWHVRWDMGRRQYYSLSGMTQSLLSSLDREVKVTVFFQQNELLTEDIRALLREYEYAARKSGGGKLILEFVDPDRDLARTRELKQQYDISEANVVVFESKGRKKYVDLNELADFEYELGKDRKLARRFAAFRGEQAFSSAIATVLSAGMPVVYFLTGHGERDVGDFDKQAGYSSLARTLTRNNIEVKSLSLAGMRELPGDCTALVIAGPSKRLSNAEVDIIAGYLERSGRLYLMLDPESSSGMEKLLEAWGVKVGAGIAHSAGFTLTGKDLIVPSYGDHPITRRLARTATMFVMPKVLEPLPVASQPDIRSDKPVVSVLAGTDERGWEEMKWDKPPFRFDEGVDRKGPVAVALAVEKGIVKDLNVEIRPTRVVVVGDSYFVSNGALSGGMGGNISFFLSSLNWLLERETMMAIAPKVPTELRLDMSRRQYQTVLLLMVLGVPGFAAMLGVAIWVRRRY